MKSKISTFLMLLILAILNVFIWEYFKTPLNDQFLQPNGEICNLSTSIVEILKYAIIALCLSIAIHLPFFQTMISNSKISCWKSILFLTIILSASAIMLDHDVKGIYLVRYMGDDFPFILRIILFFSIFPNGGAKDTSISPSKHLMHAVISFLNFINLLSNYNHTIFFYSSTIIQQKSKSKFFNIYLFQNIPDKIFLYRSK